MDYTNEEIEIDNNKLNYMKLKMLELEAENLNTQKYKKGQMIDKIIEIIKEETNKRL